MWGQERARLPVAAGEWGVTPGPYRPGLSCPRVQGGGVRLSKPRCLMVFDGSVGEGGSQWWWLRPHLRGELGRAKLRRARSDLQRRHRCHRQCPGWARAHPKPPLFEDSARGVFCVWQTSRGSCRPLTWPWRPIRIHSTSAGGRTALGARQIRIPGLVADPSQLVLRNLCK